MTAKYKVVRCGDISTECSQCLNAHEWRLSDRLVSLGIIFTSCPNNEKRRSIYALRLFARKQSPTVEPSAFGATFADRVCPVCLQDGRH